MPSNPRDLIAAAHAAAMDDDCNTRALFTALADALETALDDSERLLGALRTESARLDYVLGSYRARTALLASGLLDVATVNANGARAAIDAARGKP